jgi:ubiquinone/menaquinone biosynthesis C-methylase UbiE
MLAKARNRLGPVVACGDVGALPIRSASFDQALAVWVLHSLNDASALFAEAVRVLRPNGRFLICPVNRPAPDDRIGQAFEAMGLLVDQVTGRPHRTASAIQILRWTEASGFQGHVEALAAQEWRSTTDREIKAILDRSWSALVPLSNGQFELVTADALANLRSLPPGQVIRRAVAEPVVLEAP